MGYRGLRMFDYIVIGAGTAGCAVAARLSEDPSAQVLLIEAGPPDRSQAIKTPLAFPRLFQTPLDWNFWTEAQPALGNRYLYWPRGRVLGGSGSINAMVHMSACDADFDEWDVPGWSAGDLRPVRARVDSLMQANAAKDLNPLTVAFLDACEATGLNRAQAIDDARSPLAAPFAVNVSRGRRRSAADAYLRPALQRGNLTVWTNVHVLRLVTERERVTGVAYAQVSELQTVPAAREVILCAGAIGSPHLLLHSGIGPKHELEPLGIEVQVNLASVGQNLQDHVAAPIAHYSLLPVSVSGAGTFLNRWRHKLLGTGPLASNGAEAGAFLKSDAALPACDLEVLFSAGHYVDHGFASPGGHGFSLLPTLLKPRSRGRVRLHSADPLEPPVIDPAYLSESSDWNVLKEGVRAARQILEQAPFARYVGAPVGGEVLEPADHIRNWAQTLYHPVGTCRMGADEDAVVDTQLRVRGVEGLRVADASVMPTIPRAHTNATTLVLAERAAELIRS